MVAPYLVVIASCSVFFTMENRVSVVTTFSPILAAGEISEEDIEELCRTCLSKSQNQISLLALNASFKKTYADILMDCASVNISSGDHLPSNICQNCVRSLQMAYSFRQQCFAADTLLQYFSTDFQTTNEDNSAAYLAQEELLEFNYRHEMNDLYYCLVRNEDEPAIDSYNLNQVHITSSMKSDTLKKQQTVVEAVVRTMDSTNNKPLEHYEIKIDEKPNFSTDNTNTQPDETTPNTNEISDHQKNVKPRKRLIIKKRSTLYHCQVCTKVFSSKYRFKHHIHLHAKKPTEQVVHKCPKCDRVFNQKSKLIRHLNVHTKAIAYLCDICGLVLPYKGNLLRHRKIHTGETDFECDICGKGFIQKFSMLVHRKTHNHIGRQFQCRYCEETFDTFATRYEHQKTHPEFLEPTRNSAWNCEVCNKGYHSDKGLKQHIRTHHVQSSRRWACQKCDKEYKTQSGLKLHDVSHHLKLRNYKCTDCGKAFASSSGYNVHKLIHREQRMYKCSYCEMRFNQRGHVERHERLHTGTKPFECTYCHKMFRHKTTLTQHTRIHTGERPYKCLICERTFYHSTNLKKHTTTHKPKAPKVPLVKTEIKIETLQISNV